ncbi:hypothetical protein MAPG_08904 [Magnaporthiopsis poae ATCC 64411]|uniref:Uncharacterized protein n=1 Tax=Magnaporthiopsis poae (strain ATCC 64411 / 73-15) TaxID=644358 RepID=A0A0C4E8J5_MAGP6|nr:hypothetical protein MAPG_08904 [Magnaporthiopsis poae ATCC 64411]
MDAEISFEDLEGDPILSGFPDSNLEDASQEPNWVAGFLDEDQEHEYPFAKDPDSDDPSHEEIPGPTSLSAKQKTGKFRNPFLAGPDPTPPVPDASPADPEMDDTFPDPSNPLPRRPPWRTAGRRPLTVSGFAGWTPRDPPKDSAGKGEVDYETLDINKEGNRAKAHPSKPFEDRTFFENSDDSDWDSDDDIYPDDEEEVLREDGGVEKRESDRMELPSGGPPWSLHKHVRIERHTAGTSSQSPTFKIFTLDIATSTTEEVVPQNARRYAEILLFPTFRQKSRKMVSRPTMRTSWLQDLAFIFFLITDRQSILDEADNDMEVVIEAWISLNKRKQRFLLSLILDYPFPSSGLFWWDDSHAWRAWTEFRGIRAFGIDRILRILHGVCCEQKRFTKGQMRTGLLDYYTAKETQSMHPAYKSAENILRDVYSWFESEGAVRENDPPKGAVLFQEQFNHLGRLPVVPTQWQLRDLAEKMSTLRIRFGWDLNPLLRRSRLGEVFWSLNPTRFFCVVPSGSQTSGGNPPYRPSRWPAPFDYYFMCTAFEIPCPRPSLDDMIWNLEGQNGNLEFYIRGMPDRSTFYSPLNRECFFDALVRTKKSQDQNKTDSTKIYTPTRSDSSKDRPLSDGWVRKRQLMAAQHPDRLATLKRAFRILSYRFWAREANVKSGKFPERKHPVVRPPNVVPPGAEDPEKKGKRAATAALPPTTPLLKRHKGGDEVPSPGPTPGGELGPLDTDTLESHWERVRSLIEVPEGDLVPARIMMRLDPGMDQGRVRSVTKWIIEKFVVYQTKSQGLRASESFKLFKRVWDKHRDDDWQF